MTSKQGDFHRNLTTVLTSVIAIFGVYSLVVLTNVNKKLNTIVVKQAVDEQRISDLEKDVVNIESKL